MTQRVAASGCAEWPAGSSKRGQPGCKIQPPAEHPQNSITILVALPPGSLPLPGPCDFDDGAITESEARRGRPARRTQEEFFLQPTRQPPSLNLGCGAGWLGPPQQLDADAAELMRDSEPTKHLLAESGQGSAAVLLAASDGELTHTLKQIDGRWLAHCHSSPSAE